MTRRTWLHLGLAAAIFAGLAAYDRVDADEPFAFLEFLLEDAPEWLLTSLAISFASFVALRLRETMRERNGLAGALAEATSEGNRWRETARVHSEGLAMAIRRQFEEWRLSTGECDVAMLMLKGLSHKEIAVLRGSSSATVRQQAAAIYLKSGLSSRAELAAYFLEDLFPSPVEHRPPRPQEASGISHMQSADQASRQSVGAV